MQFLKKKKSTKGCVEDKEAVGKISEGPDLVRIHEIKYAALKTENMFKANVEHFSSYSYTALD